MNTPLVVAIRWCLANTLFSSIAGTSRLRYGLRRRNLRKLKPQWIALRRIHLVFTRFLASKLSII